MIGGFFAHGTGTNRKKDNNGYLLGCDTMSLFGTNENVNHFPWFSDPYPEPKT